MIPKVNYKHIQSIINEQCADNPITEDEAAEAFHNLVGFVSLLLQIDERIGLIAHKTK